MAPLEGAGAECLCIRYCYDTAPHSHCLSSRASPQQRAEGGWKKKEGAERMRKRGQGTDEGRETERKRERETARERQGKTHGPRERETERERAGVDWRIQPPSAHSHPLSALSLVDCESVDHLFSPLHSTQDPHALPPPHGFPSGGEGQKPSELGPKAFLGLTASTPRPPLSPTHTPSRQAGRRTQEGAEGRGAQVHRSPSLPEERERRGDEQQHCQAGAAKGRSPLTVSILPTLSQRCSGPETDAEGRASPSPHESPLTPKR